MSKYVEDQVPLGLLSAGEAAEVLDVSGNHRRGACCPGKHSPRGSLQCRIEDMGLRPGQRVEMLNNEGRGPMLVRIDESRIAIGRGVAMKVMVRRTDL